MKDNHACAAYFKEQSGWTRAFQLMKRKWESLGRLGGKICLQNCSFEEKESVGKFLGKIIEQDCIEFSLNEFENALKKTRYIETSFIELLETYFGEKLVSNLDRKAEEERNKQAFFENVELLFQKQDKYGKKAENWIRAVWNQKEYGYTLIIREMKDNEEHAFLLVKNIGKTLSILDKQEADEELPHGIPLAVLAAQTCGNPHYLDRGTVSGNLFMYALCYLQNQSYPESAIVWKQRLLEANVFSDNISSQVTVYGIHLEREHGVHSAVEEFCKMHEPLVLTAYNTKNIVRAYAENKEVFIVENEMVFDFLVESLKPASVSIVCTSGQLHATAYELLDLLAKEKCSIYYSGDLDPEGMGIADRLWKRYPQQVHIWRMAADDYKRSISHEKIGDRSITMLTGLQNEELRKTAELVQRKKIAGYQENLLQELLGDISLHILEKQVE